ncbi:MAG: hypothetical protein KF767_06570 [Bdellovibrionaceae bacterium]|nr:hypothetical protein [Pseudobdellovibrionaceae bacterium]
MLTKKVGALIGALLMIAGVGAVAADPSTSALFQEFLRRDKMRLTAEQGQAIQFLKDIKFATEDILELEILDADGRFVLRDRKDQICVGTPALVLLRCKNSMGLTTVTFQGDSD